MDVTAGQAAAGPNLSSGQFSMQIGFWFTAIPGLVGNVSTRLPVGTGDNVLIEGFIVQGPAGSTKKLLSARSVLARPFRHSGRVKKPNP